MSYAEALQRQRHDIVASMQARLDTLASEGRAASTDEAVELDGWEADIARIDGEYARAQRAEALAQQSDALRAAFAPGVQTARDERRDPTEAEILRSMVRGERGGFDSLQSPEMVRALQSLGGSAVPTTFSDSVTVYLRNLTPMFRGDVIGLFQTSTGNPIVFPRVTADQSTGGTVTAEAGGILEADPTVSSVQIDSYKYAVTTLFSAELLIDNVIDIQSVIAFSAARELAVKIGTDLTTANGSSKPNGIVNAATNGGTASGTASGTSRDTFLSPADLVDLQFSVAQGYREYGVGKYMVSTTALQKMRKFRDSNGQFLFTSSLGERFYDTFDGHPVIENAAMAAVASASKSVLFGDLSLYKVRRMPTRVDLSSDYKFSTDQLALRTIERVDGDLIDTTGIAYLVSANT